MAIETVSIENRSSACVENSTCEMEEISLLETTLVSVWYLLLTVPSLAAYIIVTRIIFTHRKDVFTNPFYKFVLSLAVADCLGLIFVISFGIFENFTQQRVISSHLAYAAGFVQNMTFFSRNPLMLAIAMNRYFAVFHHKIYPFIFTSRNAVIVCIACAAASVVLPMCAYACGILTRWATYSFVVIQKPSTCSDPVNIFLAIFVSINTTAILVTNNVIVARFRTLKTVGGGQAQEVSMRKKERRLMIQFGIISFIYLFYMISGALLPLLVKWRWGSLFYGTFAILSYGNNPFMYAIFTGEVRTRLPYSQKLFPQPTASHVTGGKSKAKG